MKDSFQDKGITFIGKTNWRNTNQAFGIKDNDRLGHIYAIGKTGTGKSTLLLNMAISDIERGNGLCIIDPHGDLCETILKYIPERKVKDVIYFNAGDHEFPIGFNPIGGIPPKQYNLVTSGLIATFKKVWSDSWGPRLEHVLRYSILSLLHHPKATLLDIQLLLTDVYFRNGVLNHVTEPGIISFWQNEFDKYPPALKSEIIAPILNKVGILTASIHLRNIIGQQKNSLDIQEIMDNGKIMICNFSKGIIGEDSSAILGAMVLTAIQSAALARASLDITQRKLFYLYVDEMQSFVTLSFADILSEARKYGLSLFLTHQYIEQLEERIRSAVFGNVGTLISFRIGAGDAKVLEEELAPVFTANDLVNLPRFSIYLKLMIDGTTSKPFSATSLPIRSQKVFLKDEIIRSCQENYGRQKNMVEEELRARRSKVSKIGLFD